MYECTVRRCIIHAGARGGGSTLRAQNVAVFSLFISSPEACQWLPGLAGFSTFEREIWFKWSACLLALLAYVDVDALQMSEDLI